SCTAGCLSCPISRTIQGVPTRKSWKRSRPPGSAKEISVLPHFGRDSTRTVVVTGRDLHAGQVSVVRPAATGAGGGTWRLCIQRSAAGLRQDGVQRHSTVWLERQVHPHQ